MVRTCGTRWPKIARPEADRMLDGGTYTEPAA